MCIYTEKQCKNRAASSHNFLESEDNFSDEHSVIVGEIEIDKVSNNHSTIDKKPVRVARGTMQEFLSSLTYSSKKLTKVGISHYARKMKILPMLQKRRK